MSNKDLESFYQSTDLLGEAYNPAQELRFAEIPTFMRAPLVRDLEQVDIGIVGIPYDGGLTCRTGARCGPREVRNQSSMMRAINVPTGVRPFELCRVADLGDVRFSNILNLDKAYLDIERHFQHIARSRLLPLSVGGDHSVTYPILKALRERYDEPLAIIHIDSHTDTWAEFQGSKFHHGAPFRLATDEGLIDPAKTVQIGIRGGQNVADGLDYSRDHGMRVISIEEFDDVGWREVAAVARRIVGDSPVYLTFDCDGLDASIIPALGTPEPGGLGWYDTLNLITALANGPGIVGMDISEIAPIEGFAAPQFSIARLIYRMLGRIKAGRRVH